MIQKRASWLVILFLGELLTATTREFFETEIAKAVILALFIPLIISSVGNSGAASTQKRKSFRSQESFAS
jgi:magnesium transporter